MPSLYSILHDKVCKICVCKIVWTRNEKSCSVGVDKISFLKSLHCLFICCIYESVIKIRSVVRILPPVAENIIGVTGLLSLAGAGLSFQADLVCHGEYKATASPSFKMLSSVWKLQYSIE